MQLTRTSVLLVPVPVIAEAAFARGAVRILLLLIDQLKSFVFLRSVSGRQPLKAAAALSLARAGNRARRRVVMHGQRPTIRYSVAPSRPVAGGDCPNDRAHRAAAGAGQRPDTVASVDRTALLSDVASLGCRSRGLAAFAASAPPLIVADYGYRPTEPLYLLAEMSPGEPRRPDDEIAA